MTDHRETSAPGAEPGSPHVTQDFDVQDDNTPLPGTFMTPRHVRILKRVVIGLGLLMVAGFIALALAITRKTATLSTKQTQRPALSKVSPPLVTRPFTFKTAADAQMLSPQDLKQRYSGGNETDVITAHIPPGAHVVSSEFRKEGYFLTLQDAGGLSILVYDTKSWKLRQIIRLAPTAQDLPH